MPFLNGGKTTTAFINKQKYICISLGVDWGGRGEDGDSFTALVVTGLRHDGRVDVLYAEKLSPADDDLEEIIRISHIYKLFGCSTIGHDFRGGLGVYYVFNRTDQDITRDAPTDLRDNNPRTHTVGADYTRGRLSLHSSYTRTGNTDFPEKRPGWSCC